MSVFNQLSIVRWVVAVLLSGSLLAAVTSGMANGHEQVDNKYYDHAFGGFLYRNRAEVSQLRVFQRPVTGSDFLDAEAVEHSLPYAFYGDVSDSLRLALSTEKYRYYIARVRFPAEADDGLEQASDGVGQADNHEKAEEDGLCLVRIHLSGVQMGEGDGGCDGIPTEYHSDDVAATPLDLSTSAIAASFPNHTADLMGIVPPGARFVVSGAGDAGIVQNDVFVLEGVKSEEYVVYRNANQQQPLLQETISGLWDIYDRPPTEVPNLGLSESPLRTASIVYWSSKMLGPKQVASNGRIGAKSLNSMKADGSKRIWYQRPNGHLAAVQSTGRKKPSEVLFSHQHETYATAHCENPEVQFAKWVDWCIYET